MISTLLAALLRCGLSVHLFALPMAASSASRQGPTTAPSDTVIAATSLPGPAQLDTPVAIARAYFSLIKAELPRAAITSLLDLDEFAKRSYGDDYTSLSPLQQLEVQELLRNVMFLGFQDPRVGELMSKLTFANFVETPISPPAPTDAHYIDFDVTGGPMPPARDRLTIAKVGDRYRVVDLWHGGRSVSSTLSISYLASGKKLPLLVFCRAMVAPRTPNP